MAQLGNRLANQPIFLFGIGWAIRLWVPSFIGPTLCLLGHTTFISM